VASRFALAPRQPISLLRPLLSLSSSALQKTACLLCLGRPESISSARSCEMQPWDQCLGPNSSGSIGGVDMNPPPFSSRLCGRMMEADEEKIPARPGGGGVPSHAGRRREGARTPRLRLSRRNCHYICSPLYCCIQKFARY